MIRTALLILILSAGGAAKAEDEAAWGRLVETSYAYLEARQDELMRDFDLAGHQRWDLDQETGALVFSNDGVPAVAAAFQFVGSFSTKSGTWLWSWANPSIEPGLHEGLQAVVAYGEANGFSKLTKAKWAAEEVDGWEMAAITAYLLKAKGVYRPPFSNGVSFVVITDIRRVSE